MLSRLVSALAALALPAVVSAITLSPARHAECATEFKGDFNLTSLPNPFVFNDGRPVITKEDWACRSAQIGAVIQQFEAGTLPGRPQHLSSTFTQTNVTGNLTITAAEGDNSITFSMPMTFPTGDPPRNGFPLVIAYGGLSIPVPDGIAVLIFDNSAMAQQNSAPASRGIGQFYDLFGANATASSMTAWVWGVSRIIDTLERTPEAHINLNKIAITGCSRNGKGALMAGAFEPRIALTIPQESGSGGDTCWRLSKFEQDSGDVVQQATEIVQENVWFSEEFSNWVFNISQLPYDHHFLAGMVAPRGLISYENTDFEWLSPLSGFGCMTAAHTIFEALEIPDHHGFVQVGNHSHCNFPTDLNDGLFAFFDKFLLDEPKANTTLFTTNGLFNGTVWDPAQWIKWKTPRLL